MSGRNIVKLLLDEARTKPVIAELLERSRDLSIDGINALATPLPWHKKALLAIRAETERAEALQAAKGFAGEMGEITETPPQRGIVVRHTGIEVNITPPARAGRPMAILVKTGDILFVTRDATWHGSLSLGHPNIPCEVIQRDASRNDYFRHYEREAPSMDLRGALPIPGEMHPSGLFRVMR